MSLSTFESELDKENGKSVHFIAKMLPLTKGEMEDIYDSSCGGGKCNERFVDHLASTDITIVKVVAALKVIVYRTYCNVICIKVNLHSFSSLSDFYKKK